MRVQIRRRNLELNPELMAYFERRVRISLARFGDKIQRVTVRMSDVNGPKGGFDQKCAVHLTLSDGTSILAEQTDFALDIALGKALRTATRRVRESEDRVRSRRIRQAARGKLGSRRLESPATQSDELEELVTA